MSSYLSLTSFFLPKSVDFIYMGKENYNCFIRKLMSELKKENE